MNQKHAITCNYIYSFLKCCHIYRNLNNVNRFLCSRASQNSRKLKNISPNHIAKEGPADLIIEKLKNDIKSDDVIIEVEPGSGILTKKLVNNFYNKVLVFDSDTNIKEIKFANPNKLANVSVTDIPFYDFYKYFWLSNYYFHNEKHKKFIEVLQKHCGGFSDFKILGTICHKKFFYSLMFDYIYRGTLFHGYFNPTFYMFVPYEIYASLMKVKHSKIASRLGISFSIYFDIMFLGSSSIQGFHVFNKNKCKPIAKFSDLYLLKFSPKDANVIKKKTNNQLPSFYFFVGSLLRLKENSDLLNGLERFIPDCGEEFIENGFRAFEQPHEMSEDDWFKAFNIFTSHPSFESSFYSTELKRFMGVDDHLEDLYEAEEAEECCEKIEDYDSHLQLSSIHEEIVPEMFSEKMCDSEINFFM